MQSVSGSRVKIVVHCCCGGEGRGSRVFGENVGFVEFLFRFLAFSGRF
jgi:hypothetical protein